MQLGKLGRNLGLRCKGVWKWLLDKLLPGLVLAIVGSYFAFKQGERSAGSTAQADSTAWLERVRVLREDFAQFSRDCASARLALIQAGKHLAPWESRSLAPVKRWPDSTELRVAVAQWHFFDSIAFQVTHKLDILASRAPSLFRFARRTLDLSQGRDLDSIVRSDSVRRHLVDIRITSHFVPGDTLEVISNEEELITSDSGPFIRYGSPRNPKVATILVQDVEHWCRTFEQLFSQLDTIAYAGR
jgi:hypothetical protein